MTMRGHNIAVRPFDVTQIEGEIHEAVQQRPPRIQAVDPVPRVPGVPDYVNHREDVSEIGRLSAEAIVREYEVTAKEIEAVGDFVREMAQRCEQLTTSASAMLKEIKTTAARYRKEGKRIFNEIESCSSATDEVRQLCESFRDKIAAKTTEGAT
jgi:signal transduction protein with GAF and PtsI domain